MAETPGYSLLTGSVAQMQRAVFLPSEEEGAAG
jgi:hypothetical protein